MFGLFVVGEDPCVFLWFEIFLEVVLDVVMSLFEKLGVVEEGAITWLGEYFVALFVYLCVVWIVIEVKCRGFEEVGAVLVVLVAECEIRFVSCTCFGHGLGFCDDEVGALDLFVCLDEFEVVGFCLFYGSLCHVGLDGWVVCMVIEVKCQFERVLC